jgi:citrate lyase subunit beta/citryl-CoA lyase
MRSYLFVPGDSAAKLAKGLGCGADALLLDLEDSVAPALKPVARQLVADFLERERDRPGRPQLFVRINSRDTGMWDADLDAVVPAMPDGLLLPKARSGADVAALAAAVDDRERGHGLAPGGIGLIVLATEVAISLLDMKSYVGSSRRLRALTWGAEDLLADLGGTSNRDETGAYASPYRLARDLTLVTAAAAAVPAIDTVFVDIGNIEGLRAECKAAVRDGFSGKMAIHPAQVPVINEVFTPSADEVARARRIVDHFAANPGAGVVAIDGKMIDRPHIRAAERIIARARFAGVG